MQGYNARCLQLGYESLRILITDQWEVFRPRVLFVLPSHCTKDVHTPQGSTRDLWTVVELLVTWFSTVVLAADVLSFALTNRLSASCSFTMLVGFNAVS
jgi:hypothetical protein